MRVAVLSLTRDRLPYTQHCFGRLRELAGCEFEHLILDQGSQDGTQQWLRTEYPWSVLVEQPKNIGIHKGMNLLLASALAMEPDVIVKFDNDCELLTDGTLAAVAEAVTMTGGILSPRILGLRNPPPMTGLGHFGGHPVELTAMIGGIFLAAPAAFYERFRFDEASPIHGTDDDRVCAHARADGRIVGYLTDFEANHYLTTDGQVEDIPWYFERRVQEGGRPR